MGLDMSKLWHGPAVDWRRLLPLAAGTLALLLGLFCAWQTWLIAREGTVAQGVQDARDPAAQALAAEIPSDGQRPDGSGRRLGPGARATAAGDPA